MEPGESYQKNIIETAIRLDREICGKKISSPSWMSRQIEILFNLIGFIFGFLFFRLAPPETANAITKTFAFYKSGWKNSPLLKESLNHITIAKNMAELFRKMSGRKPAIFFVSTHPETSSVQAHLLGKLILQSIEAGELISPKSKFKILQAIDFFALDTLPQFSGAIYSGLMASGHVAVDRFPEEKTFLQKFLFRKNHYRKSIFHLLKNLRDRKIVFAALGGGVVHNSKIFYTAKEFAQKCFYLAPSGKLSKRDVEKEIIAILSRRGTCSACATGSLADKEKEEILKYLKGMGLTAETVLNQLKELEDEMKSYTPYRLRLFKIVFKRLCGRNIPLLLIPISHTHEGKINLKPSLLVTDYNGKNDSIKLIEPEGKITEKNRVELMKEFVRKNLNP